MPKFVDWSGKKVGRVKVINIHDQKCNTYRYNCICDCGNGFIAYSRYFSQGAKFECKKCVFERKRGPDLTGRKYGRWTVLKRSVDKRNKTVWHCLCDCGNYGFVSSSCLGKKSKSMSCGCYGRKIRSKHVNTTLYPPAHGLCKSKFYGMRISLIHKCYNENHPSYHLFGGSGITVCELWRNGAKDMLKWAKDNGWNEGDIFCLKEGKKEFNPENTMILSNEQFRSESALKNGLQVTYQGDTHSVQRWSKILGVSPVTLRKRIYNYPSLDLVFGSIFRKNNFVRDPTLTLKAVELYKSGKSQTEIAKILNTCQQNIRYHLEKNNIEIRENDRKRPKRKEISDQEILNLCNSGNSLNAIARLLNCSWPTIKNRLDKMHGKKRDRSKG